MRVTRFLLPAAAAAALAPPAFADPPEVDRTVRKEPAYAAKPRYVLLAVGPAARHRVWLALDKSGPAAGRYDVLYADLNADGDLTGPGERFAAKVDGEVATFQLPDLPDPATGATHTGVRVRAEAGDDPVVRVGMKWRGKHKMGGGYPEDPAGGYMRAGPTPAAAPVVWADGDGPLRFQRWYSGRLRVGGADDFRVFLGQRGAGPASFWAFTEHVLPAGEGVRATLVYTDAAGREQRAPAALADRC